jgi:hypothetical protein
MTKSHSKLPSMKIKTAIKAGRLSANHNARPAKA